MRLGALFALCVLVQALLAGPGPSEARVALIPAGLRGQHEIESILHVGEGPVVDCGGSDYGRELHATVLGFLPYWTGSAWLQYDLLSILACFCVDMGAQGQITSWHGFPEVFEEELLGIHSSEGIGVVTVCCFSSSSIHSILTTYRETAISTIVALVVDNDDVDGACIDFENVSSSDRDNLTAFMQELREELDLAAPGSHLSICTPAVDWSGAFDYDVLAGSVDALMMMCYAFSGSWSTVAGPNCPLTGWGSSPSSPTNMMWTLGDYIIYAPEVHEKLVVGLPYYGHQWQTESGDPHSAVTGSCQTLTYEVLAERAETYGELWDQESMTPWYAFYSAGWNQGWFDSDSSLVLKYDMLRRSGMQGIGIWALGYDGDRPELWQAIEDTFGEPALPDDRTDNLESTFTLRGPEAYWHYTGTGDMLSHFYTFSVASGPDVNWASWRFTLEDSTGACWLEAMVNDGATAGSAFYRVHHAGGCDTVPVDQSAWQGQWVSLGGPYRVQGELEVELGDATGVSGERITFDAVRLSWLTGVGDGSASDLEPCSRFYIEVSPSPARSFLFTILPHEGTEVELGVFDLAGRLVERASFDECSSRSLIWPGPAGAAPGVYLLRAWGGGQTILSRIVLVP
ncbi:hypothetical protein JW921_00315 [Candidatus Fermentibacterales bacterium]|nr:hypothetical protein [Candidatus Fermentibacterales bacterium]